MLLINRKGVLDTVEFDYSKLKGRIIEKYDSISKFVDDFGGTIQNFSLKLNNKVQFSQKDIIKIVDMLDIPIEYIGIYF